MGRIPAIGHSKPRKALKTREKGLSRFDGICFAVSSLRQLLRIDFQQRDALFQNTADIFRGVQNDRQAAFGRHGCDFRIERRCHAGWQAAAQRHDAMQWHFLHEKRPHPLQFISGNRCGRLDQFRRFPAIMVDHGIDAARYPFAINKKRMDARPFKIMAEAFARKSADKRRDGYRPTH